VERAAASPGKALVGFNWRWHRLIRAARDVIDDGRVGSIVAMHTAFTSRNGAPAEGSDWRGQPDLGGGVLFDLGIHHFDLWRFLLRSEIEEVFAHHRADDRAIAWATVSAVMTNGAQITASFSHGLSNTNEIEIIGREGRVRLSCYRFDSLRVSRHAAPRGAV